MDESKFFNKEFLIKLLLLILMTTPSFGILYIFTGVHVSNEKFGLLISVIYLLLNLHKNKILVKDALIAFALLLAIIVPTIIRIFFYDENIQDQDISLVVWCISLPIYLAIFRKNPNQNSRIFVILLLIQTFAFVMQMLGKSLGFIDVESIFIHNPIQANYEYPQLAEGIYRVSGFFNESSQISIFFAVMYWYFKNKKWSILLLPLILLTFSITGYLMALMLLFSLRISRYLLLLIFSLPFIAFGILSSFVDTVLYRTDLIISSLSGSGDYNEPRIDALIKNVSQFIDRPMTGYGALAENAERWDIFSVYVYPYGLIGGLIWVFFIIYFLYKFKVLWFYWPVLLTNVTVLSYINLLFLIVCISKRKISKLVRYE